MTKYVIIDEGDGFYAVYKKNFLSEIFGNRILINFVSGTISRTAAECEKKLKAKIISGLDRGKTLRELDL